jgi:hypothetical protein
MSERRNRIVDIIGWIGEIRSGRKALEQAGLTSPATPTESDPEDNIPLIERINVLLPGNINVNNLRDDDTTRLLMRSLQAVQSVEEQRMRHRHREAMVLNDGSRPVNSDDIIQRPESPS